MTQALYAHMNNKTIKKNHFPEPGVHTPAAGRRRPKLSSLLLRAAFLGLPTLAHNPRGGNRTNRYKLQGESLASPNYYKNTNWSVLSICFVPSPLLRSLPL
jgi:hypothetical protein